MFLANVARKFYTIVKVYSLLIHAAVLLSNHFVPSHSGVTVQFDLWPVGHIIHTVPLCEQTTFSSVDHKRSGQVQNRMLYDNSRGNFVVKTLSFFRQLFQRLLLLAAQSAEDRFQLLAGLPHRRSHFGIMCPGLT